MLQPHNCSLRLGSDSMLPKDDGASICSRAGRELRKLGQISEHHPRTFKHFRSYPAIVAERQKQLTEGRRYLIHPFSLFRSYLYWRSFMALIDIAHMIVSTTRFCFVSQHLSKLELHPVDNVLLALHIICAMDMLVHFNTGYKKQRMKYTVMERSRIACGYVRRHFVFDLISCTPLAFALLCLEHRSPQWVMLGHIMPVARVTRICQVLAQMNDLFTMIFARFYATRHILHHLVLLILLIHGSNCFLYLVPTVKYYSTGLPSRYAQFLNWSEIYLFDYPLEERYRKALFISVSAFFGTGFSLYRLYEPHESLIITTLILGSASYYVYTIVFLLNLYMTKYSSSMRYYELMNEVELNAALSPAVSCLLVSDLFCFKKKYMRFKQFPTPLKKRVRVFYNYRYQEHYFKEETTFKCLSEHLRHEVILHTCHKLVKNVALFEGLPARLVGTLLGCLKPEVHLPNDLVVRAGEIGHCMYFIANGTVAVYSLKGAEVCHLEDGAYFGEVALLMKDSKRVATVVAVEITQVYRLDVADFRRYVMTEKVLFDRIEALASKRMHETVLLDEAFRRERDQKLIESAPETPKTKQSNA